MGEEPDRRAIRSCGWPAGQNESDPGKALRSLTMTSDRPAGDPEPISPELVLVSSPETARTVREGLPVSVSPSEQAEGPAADRLAVPDLSPKIVIGESRAEPVTRPRVRLVVVVCVLTAIAAAAVWYVLGDRGSDSLPTTHSAAQPALRSAAKGTAGFVPARTWAWVPSKGARGYTFQMALNGHVVLRVRTKQPRLTLPHSFRFHSGTYRWTVERIPVAPDHGPLSESSFVLTDASAIRANH
jgi:hypothetical protein